MSPAAQGEGTPQPSKQTSGKKAPTHLAQQELLLDVGGHRIPDSNSLCRAKEKQVTLCFCRCSHWLRAGGRRQMENVVAVPSPTRRQP